MKKLFLVSISTFILLNIGQRLQASDENNCNISTGNSTVTAVNNALSNNDYRTAYSVLQSSCPVAQREHIEQLICYCDKKKPALEKLVQEDNAKEQEAASKASAINKTEAEACEAGLYKDCYKGVPWGTTTKNDEVADKLGCISTQEKRLVGYTEVYVPSGKRVNLMTRTTPIRFYVEDDIQEKLSKYRSKKIPIALEIANEKLDSCKAIMILDNLVGFYYFSPSASDDEYLFIKASLKKKYGKNPVEKNANSTDFVSWANVNGINILMVHSNKEIFVRYIHVSTFNEVLRMSDEYLAGLEKSKEKKESESRKDILKGL